MLRILNLLIKNSTIEALMVEVGKCDDSLYYLANLEKIASCSKLPSNKALDCALNQIFNTISSQNNSLINIDSLDIAFNRNLAERVLQVLNNHFSKNLQLKLFDLEDKNACIEALCDLLWKVKKTMLPDDKSSSKTFYFQKNKSTISKRWQKRVFRTLSDDPSTPQFFSLIFHQDCDY